MNEVPENRRRTTADILRAAFVEMLFALAVSQVAIYAADLVEIEKPWKLKLPAIAHLLVGLLLIAASWLGWKRSRSPGMLMEVKHPFSILFLGLLIDVFLVILYFIVVRTVEINARTGDLTPPTAIPEAFWIGCVFAVYAFWDLVTDVLSPGAVPGRSLRWLGKAVRAAIVSMFASVVCMILAYVVYRFATRSTGEMSTLLLDGALLSVILFFRVIKALENKLAPLFRVSDCEAFAIRPPHGYELPVGIVLAILYSVLLLSVCVYW